MNKRKEKISAFLDNDIHSDELMSFSLSAESDDAKIAQRYQMMGDALRGEMSNSSFVDVSQAVREALVKENIFDEQLHKDVLLTEATATKAELIPESLSDKSGIFIAPPSWLLAKYRSSLNIILSAWLRPIAGMAVAASVAVVMVVTLSEQETGLQSIAVKPAVINQGQQPILRVAVDDIAKEKTEIAGNKTAGSKVIDIDQRLINQHLEFATQDALQGRLPYVRAVSFESKQ